MTDWRTDRQTAGDERARPGLLAEAAIFIGFWALGMALPLVSLIHSLF